MKKIPGVPFIIFPLCICITPVSAQPISAPQQGQSVYSPQQQPVSAPQQRQPVYSPQQQPVAVGNIPPGVTGTGKITEELSTGQKASLEFRVTHSGKSGRRAFVALDSGGYLDSALGFDLYYLQNTLVGFEQSLASVEKAKQQGLSGIEKEVFRTEPGPNGATQKFSVKVSPEGEPKIVVISFPPTSGDNTTGFTVEEIQAFQRLLARLPEAQQKLVQGAQL